MKLVRRLLCERGETGHRSGTRAYLIQQNPGNHEAAHDQENHLNDVRQCDGSKTAVQRVSHRKYSQAGQSEAQIHTRYRIDGQSTQPKDRR